MNRLNIGCGYDVRPGWINLDCVALPGVGIIHDINDQPFPFEADTFDEILCKDVLEHVNYVPVLSEIHRILKPGGKAIIQVPHFTSKDAFADPTHCRFFTVHTLRYFTDEHLRSYYAGFSFSMARNIYIHFDRRPAYFYNYLLARVVNLSTGLQNLYEGSPLRIFPATNVTLELIK